MKAIQVHAPGGPDKLVFVDIPAPTPRPNEALVQLHAIGVNYIDVYFREGRYPATYPLVLGQEGAGVVAEVGSEVQHLKLGDRVAYTGTPGSYAQYAAVPANRLVRIPEGLDFRQATAVMLQGMTAHYLVHSSYALKSSDTALIHAAAGGTGALLVQMAKRIGARVIATAGTEEKAVLARESGADYAIIYSRQDFEVETKRIMAGAGVHVVYDGVGKDTFLKGLNVLRPRGYMVLYGGASGAVPAVEPIVLSQKGSLFLTRPTLAHYIATRAELEQRAGDVLGAVQRGELKLRMVHEYPLADAAQAHRDLEARHTTGKLLLIP